MKKISIFLIWTGLFLLSEIADKPDFVFDSLDDVDKVMFGNN